MTASDFLLYSIGISFMLFATSYVIRALRQNA